jgi:hypothetical protein
MNQETKDQAIEALLASGGMPIQIDPSVLFGWREGEALDVRAYAAVDLHHPKDHDFYDSLHHSVPDPEIWTIFKGIRDSGRVDDPILVFLHRENRQMPYQIFVLDGATRTSCVSFLRGKFPHKFKTLPMCLFEGTLSEAKGEMVRRNLENRSRTLKPAELVYSIGRLLDAGVSEFDAAKICGIESRSGLARNCANIHEKGSKNLLKALENGIIDIQQAARLSSLPESQQNIQINNALNKETIHYNGKTSDKPKKMLPIYAGQLRMCKGIEKKLDSIQDCLNVYGDENQRKLLKKAYGSLHCISKKILAKDRIDSAKRFQTDNG